ncbi:unnamed protein product [Mycena citricolor]|uniref:Uncharacterized protein n=1 Tax=Mycena citricolor TaxID=2018698 RepID=A0AAD2HBL7_9AGAR|nr:unnamed protein product [Mycena citricolor]
MPQLKRRRVAQNLGSHAKKKIKRSETPVSNHKRDDDTQSRASLDANRTSELAWEKQSIESNESEESDVSVVVDDVPELADGLLASAQTKLRVLMTRMKIGTARGNYYKSSVGGVPAARTEHLHRAQQAKMKKAHGGGILSWLKPKELVSMPCEETERDDEQQLPDSDGSESASLLDRPASPTPSENSGLAEEGLNGDIDLVRLVSEQPDQPELGSESANETAPATLGTGTAAPPPCVHFAPLNFDLTRGNDMFKPITPAATPCSGAPPPPKVIDAGIEKLQAILRPSRGPNTKGYRYATMNNVLRGRLELVLAFLQLYKSSGYMDWGTQADLIAKSAGAGVWMSRRIREWSLAFMEDETLPVAEYGKFNGCVLDDEDISQTISLQLQTLGPFISAQNVVDITSSEEMQQRLKLKKPISVRTAERWMKRHEYRWTSRPKGMYSDGHEREDVVAYCQNVFLPRWREYSKHTRKWTKVSAQRNGVDVEVTEDHKRTKKEVEESKWEEWEEDAECVFVAGPDGRIVVIWRHDESIFYAHDRRTLCWVLSSETAKPLPKGEGKSLMFIAFVSPDHGWAARMSIRPGANRDGYYGNKEILEHATAMMDYLDANHPDEKHVLAYDNATNHTARAPDALSARKMPMNTPGIDKKTNTQKNWFAKAKVDGKDVTVCMRNASFANGKPQALYFPQGHPKAGIFKGMRVLIQERIAKGANLPDPSKLKAECKGFNCPPGRTDCCCRRILFTQPVKC